MLKANMIIENISRRRYLIISCVKNVYCVKINNPQIARALFAQCMHYFNIFALLIWRLLKFKLTKANCTIVYISFSQILRLSFLSKDIFSIKCLPYNLMVIGFKYTFFAYQTGLSTVYTGARKLCRTNPM
jgi:hypothetical protein